MPSHVLYENIVMSGFVVAFLQSTHPSASAESNLRFVCLTGSSKQLLVRSHMVMGGCTKMLCTVIDSRHKQ